MKGSFFFMGGFVSLFKELLSCRRILPQGVLSHDSGGVASFCQAIFPLYISYFSARETSLPSAHLFNVCLHSSTSPLCADWRKSDRGIGGGIQIPEAKLQAFLFLFPSRRPKSAPESLLSGQETFNANHSWGLLGSCLGLNRINQIKYCK